jgi:hypothetical protein
VIDVGASPGITTLLTTLLAKDRTSLSFCWREPFTATTTHRFVLVGRVRMVTFQNIRDAVYEEIRRRKTTAITVCKYDGNPHAGKDKAAKSSFTIEISPNPEKVVLIDFSEDSVEIYDAYLTEPESINQLDIADPNFLEKLFVALGRLGIKLLPTHSQ